MIVGLVWALALLTSGVILFQAARSVFRSGRRFVSELGRLSTAAGDATTHWQETLSTTGPDGDRRTGRRRTEQVWR